MATKGLRPKDATRHFQFMRVETLSARTINASLASVYSLLASRLRYNARLSGVFENGLFFAGQMFARLFHIQGALHRRVIYRNRAGVFEFGGGFPPTAASETHGYQHKGENQRQHLLNHVAISR
jgi:hypothetical protein